MSDKGLATARLLLRVGIGVLIVVEIVLVLGVVLQATAANPDAGFAEFVYRNQDRVMTPFEGIFDDVTLDDSDGVIDVSAVFAIAVYVCLFIPLGMALGWVDRARLRNDARRHQAADEERTARMFGAGPATVVSERPSFGQRLRSLFDRKPTQTSEPADGE